MTATELEMLRLPCGHLHRKPDRLVVTVVCPCGRTWRLARTNTEWTARETERAS